MTNDRRHKAFLTAKARRTKQPLIWTVDDETTLHLKASAEIAEVAELLTGMTVDPPEGTTGMDAVIWRHGHYRGLVRHWIEADDQAAWDRISPDFDIQTLVEMAQDLVAEYSGANPTKPPSSEDGSPVTGESSTDGAAPAESTPSP